MSGAAAGAAAGLMIANNLKRLQAGLDAAPAAWQPLLARGLALVTERNRPALRGAPDGIDVAVEIVTDWVHNAHTRIRAIPRQPGEAKVGVYPSPDGALKSIRDWLHQDVDIGDPAFDDAFLITSRPTDAARARLTPALREQLTSLAGGRLIGFAAFPEAVTVLLNGVETDAAALSTALDIVLTTARG